MVTAIAVRAGTDGLQHPRVTEGRDVAALLQIKTDLIDTAGGIDREHELEVDHRLCRRRHAGGKRQQQCCGAHGAAPDRPRAKG